LQLLSIVIDIQTSLSWRSLHISKGHLVFVFIFCLLGFSCYTLSCCTSHEKDRLMDMLKYPKLKKWLNRRYIWMLILWARSGFNFKYKRTIEFLGCKSIGLCDWHAHKKETYFVKFLNLCKNLERHLFCELKKLSLHLSR
jgi:hypothetical protein